MILHDISTADRGCDWLIINLTVLISNTLKTERTVELTLTNFDLHNRAIEILK